MATKIEWATETWNPITGCTKISPGCKNCYAERMANRLAGRYGYPADEPFRPTFHEDRLEQPIKWAKPRMIFVCSMGDLFVDLPPPDGSWPIVDRILKICARTSRHTFLLLTKRIEAAWYYFNSPIYPDGPSRSTLLGKNVWLGVTAENQEQADKRIPILLQIPAAVRFVSVEPMLGPVDMRDFLGVLDPIPFTTAPPDPGLQWVICGGESGHGARPMQAEWVRLLRDQCVAAGVPFFFKQWGEWGLNWMNDRNGKIDGSEWMDRMGKKAAGRLLDGCTWDQYPQER